jgi:glutaredoxin-related protein
MTTHATVRTPADAPFRNRRERFFAEVDSAPVVVFRSPVTDVRELIGRLESAGVKYREIELTMASYLDRERFHALQACTGWRTLPQVFVNGAFVGGEPELARHAVLAAGAPRATPRLERLVGWLGYAGVLPFVLGLLAVALIDDAGWRARMGELTLAYGAVILAFLGAVHWGRLLERGTLQQAPLLAAWGVLPSIVGWLSLALPFAWAAPIQALLFLGVYVTDRQLLRQEPAAQPYLTLRARLTGLVASLMLGTWAVGTLG